MPGDATHQGNAFSGNGAFCNGPRTRNFNLHEAGRGCRPIVFMCLNRV
ncbi:hypothetical protein EDC25_12040 [Pseudofulvimonas gallinarii]|jgi:hypothetical protein|uniref:Sulfatase-modifying factor enzyme 1 n=1 Tax=Pseudofulvimonas gallinarii TaxID=634155 RepID=A0A4R3L5R6_9GAMM|nr:hypothetical protein EDC25_12040 [Pseudofulvimonas gallinarii]